MPRKLVPDLWLFGVAVVLLSAGVVMVYSASAIVAADRFHDPYFFLKKQIFWALLAAGVEVIVNFAAESHVDRSIGAPDDFIRTDVFGAFVLLEAARQHHIKKFIQISTDEVYGSILKGSFKETDALMPSSPYSASKAGADRLAYSYFVTYGVPVIITRCSNNYGPYQFPEKLIPLMITNALAGKPLPVYGDGRNVRDWLYVLDHCDAVRVVLERGRSGETYNIGGGAERANIELVRKICALLDEASPRKAGSYAELISFVEDRPGHDRRYAIDSSKIARELGWRPRESFDSGLAKTVRWYVEHRP